MTTPETRHCTISLRKTFPALTLAQVTQWKSPARRSNLLRASKRGRPLRLNYNYRRMPLSILIIGGSDAGISAALRAHELDASARVAVVLADAFPNFSICGLPFFLSEETPDWKHLAHRTEYSNDLKDRCRTASGAEVIFRMLAQVCL